MKISEKKYDILKRIKLLSFTAEKPNHLFSLVFKKTFKYICQCLERKTSDILYMSNCEHEYRKDVKKPEKGI